MILLNLIDNELSEVSSSTNDGFEDSFRSEDEQVLIGTKKRTSSETSCGDSSYEENMRRRKLSLEIKI